MAADKRNDHTDHASEFDEDSFDDDVLVDEIADEDFGDSEDPDSPEEDFEAEWEDQPAKKPQKAKKSLLSFNTLLILGGVLLGGYFMLSSLNKSGSEKAAKQAQGPAPTMLNITSVMDGVLSGQPTAPSDPVASETENAVDTGFLNELEENVPTQAEPPQPAPISPTETSDVTESEIESVGDVLTPMPSLDDETPIFPALDSETPSVDLAIPSPPPALPEAVEMVAPQTIEQPVNQAESILQEMVGKRAEQSPPSPELSQEAESNEISVDEALPAITSPSPQMEETGPDLSGLNSKIESLVARMGALERTVLQSASPVQSGNESLSEDIVSLRAEIETLKKELSRQGRQEPTPSKDSKTPKKAVSSVKKAAPEPYPRTSLSPRSPENLQETWVLRAAQPGRAWISKTGERDMRSVTVGDTVPGLGQITGITFESNRWVVVGTQDRVIQ